MGFITVQHLHKQYEVVRKQAGLRGTLRALVHRKREYVDAVSDVSFEIAEGEIVGFLGPNGAGKTTTLKMLSGILYPTSGTVRVLGHIPQQRSNEFKKQFGIVMGQKDQLWRSLPAMDNFRLIQALYGVPDAEFTATIQELIELLGIQDFLDIPVRKLSLGQRMKCELVAALLHSPRVLFLDEPTIGLDVVAQKNIRDFIKKYNREKRTTIMLTSHYMDDIKELCERVIIINFGTIMYDGPLATLITTYAKDKMITVMTLEEVPREAFCVFGEVDEYEGVRVKIRVPRAQVKDTAARIITSNIPIDDILIDEMSIDDIIRVMFDTRASY